MSLITIDLGITGLTNVNALPFSADFTTVWNGVSLTPISTTTPSFINMPEVYVNGVGCGTYIAELPTALESIDSNDGLWISIYDAGPIPSVSDPLYGYVPPSCESTLITAVIDAIGKLEINIDPCDLRRALEGTVIKPTRTVLGPCQQRPVTNPLGFKLNSCR